MNKEAVYKSNTELMQEIEELRMQLHEVQETIEAIRTGQIDALVVEGEEGHQLYTLKSADQAYRVFIEQMTEGAVTLNERGVILYCNSSFANLVRRSLSQVIGLPFKSFLTLQSRAIYEDLFEKCWTRDCKGEVNIDVVDETPVQLSLKALEMEEGSSLSIIITDLTAQKFTQQQLLENNHQLAEMNRALEISNHDLQQFASIASHDLQEPLRKIQIFSNLLKEKEELLPPELKRNVYKIIDSSARMKSLIIDILNYSKLSANETYWECVDLNEIVNDLKEDFELILEEKKAVIDSMTLPSIDGNRGQIRQVFQNIVSNALKFARDDVSPRIHVTVRRVEQKDFTAADHPGGPYCIISIEDNGIGFDQKYVDNIFFLFERLNSKNLYEGTGIGLAIAKKIVEKHNGLITATGKEGKGAVFQILLPLLQT